SRRALHQLSRDKVVTAMWFVEDHAVFTYWRAFAPLYDIFAVIQKEPFLGLLKEVGVDNALYLPLAADPEFHRPVELTPLERRQYGSDLSFVGAGYPNRRRVFARLMQYDLKIWGSDWEGELTLAGRLQRGGARIEPEEAVKIFNASSINLNLHSSLARDGQVVAGDFVNPRTFELAACGAFQLVDRRTLLGELFQDDELGVFEDVDQLTDLIEHYLPRQEERKKCSRRARERVLQEHTYDRRMRSLIEFTARRLPDWPRERGSEAAWPDFPPDLRQELSGLLDRLGLPATVAFKDLVWAVRSQQGRLSRLETAILFLDEWQKQYGRRS
ncbi:MAG: CgeB family protein, partial [Desulfohalobiaceae bacterium]